MVKGLNFYIQTLMNIDNHATIDNFFCEYFFHPIYFWL